MTESASDKKRSGGWKWVVGLLVSQFAANAPWFMNQAQAYKAGTPLRPPEGWELVLTCVGFVGASLAAFSAKVWKELEADAVRGTSRMLKAAPAAAYELIGRCWDVLAGTIGRWFAGLSFTRRYLAELRYKHGLFNDKGLGLINANRLDLEKVYVDLKASADARLNRPNLNPVSREVRKRAPVWDHLRTLRPGFALVIIGAPGCGKTTLLQHVLLIFANDRQWRRRTRARIPFFVEVREIARQLQAKNEPTLPKLLEVALKKDRQTAEIGKRLPKGWLEKTLRSGRCVLLWDGLDEVANLEERSKVAAWLDRVIESPDWRGNVSLITARPAGYHGAQLRRAQVLEVQPFAFEDTKRFISQWYHATEVVSSGNKDDKNVRRRAADEANALLTALQDNQRLGDLTSNPLLLTMICMVHRYHGALPGSRGQLYAEICQVLLERWRQQRGITDPYSGNQKLQVLRPLAAWMMDHPPKEISTEVLLNVIAVPISRIGVASGRESALAFLKQLQDGSGLLLERELGTWGFAHLSFQEYLCADEWVSQPANAPADWASRVAQSWWRETLLLYASRAADAGPLVKAALDHGAHQALALAMRLHGEKLNLDVATRGRVELAVVTALESRDENIYRPAGEAWLDRQQELNYHRLDETTEVGGWVTQAEFQSFMLSDLVARSPSGHVPATWKLGWFQGGPKDPVLGVSSRMASTYVEWLNERFPALKHRLPRPEECENQHTWLTWCNDGVGTSLHGECSPAIMTKLSNWLQARPEAGNKANALGFKSARALEYEHLARTRNRSDGLSYKFKFTRNRSDHDIAFDLASALDRNITIKLAKELGYVLSLPSQSRWPSRLRSDADGVPNSLSQGLEFEFDFHLAVALSLALDRLPHFDRDLNIHRDLARTLGFRSVEVLQELRLEIESLMSRPYSDRKCGRRLQCLTPLLTLWEPNVTLTIEVDAYRRFWVACFDVLRMYAPRSITREIARVERSMRVLVARADGELPAWEGLRVVRERRV